MIEVKDWKVAIAKDEIEKFEKNLANSPYFKVGILLSMTAGLPGDLGREDLKLLSIKIKSSTKSTCRTPRTRNT